MAKQIIVTQNDYGIELETQFVDDKKKPLDITDYDVRVKIIYDDKTIDTILAGHKDSVNGIAYIVLEKEHLINAGLHTSVWSVVDEDEHVTAQENVYYFVKDVEGSEDDTPTTDLPIDADGVLNKFNEIDNNLFELTEQGNVVNEEIDSINEQLDNIEKQVTITLDKFKHLVIENDYSTAINTALEYLSSLGGGTLTLNGKYTISNTIKIKDNVTLCGNGQENTLIEVNEGCTCNAIETDWSTGYSIHDLAIKIPRTNTLGNCLVLGNLENRIDVWGISIYNLYIQESAENGILIQPKFWVVNFNNLMIRKCNGSGILNKSSDNTFSNIFTFDCRWGIRNEASNNKVINCKFTFCGMTTYTDNPTSFSPSASSGIYNKGCKRNTYVNCECQDNYGYGFSFVDSYNLMLSNLLADRCGTYAHYIVGQENGGYGFNFENCYNIIGDIATDNYLADKVQTGLNINDSCYDISLNYVYKDQNGTDIINGKNITIETPVVKKYKNMLLNKYMINNFIKGDFSNINVTNATKEVSGTTLIYTPTSTSNQLTINNQPLVLNKKYKLLIEGTLLNDWSQVNINVQINGANLDSRSVTLSQNGKLNIDMNITNTNLSDFSSSAIVLTLGRSSAKLNIENIQWYEIDNNFTTEMTKMFVEQNKKVYGNSVIQYSDKIIY